MEKKYFRKTQSENFLNREAKERHITHELINETCFIELEGSAPILYIQEKHNDLNQLGEIISKLDFNSSTRSANKGEKSLLFGAVNKSATKIGVCNQGVLLSKNSEMDETVRTDIAYLLDDILKEYLPERHKIARIKLLQKPIEPEYKFGDTNYTSGIINKNSAFNYHRDTGNLSNTYSSMIVFKKNVTGGHLVLPEYGIGFKLQNNSIINFYGKEIVHGVTPIIKHDKDAFRLSLVYYASQNLDKCLPFEEELKQAQNKKI